MKSTATPQHRSILVAALVAAGLGTTGIAIAADYGAATPKQSPAATSPAPSTATPSAAPSTGNMAAIAPNKSETPDSAFKKLDASQQGLPDDGRRKSPSGF